MSRKLIGEKEADMSRSRRRLFAEHRSAKTKAYFCLFFKHEEWKGGSDISGVLELPDQEFKTTIINKLRALMSFRS